MKPINFELKYEGNLTDQNKINLYDLGQAIIGFQRSLAITTHLILNDEIITQAPSLKGAEIIASPFEVGSWKILTILTLIGGGIYTLGTAPRDTPVGNLVSSAYDYVVSESLGFHVDYKSTLGQQYDKLEEQKVSHVRVTQSRLDSVVEKCDKAIKDMHRPIVASETAKKAIIKSNFIFYPKQFDYELDDKTYDYISFSKRPDDILKYEGFITSYNSNTFKGRIFVPRFGRPIPFELVDFIKTDANVNILTNSLSQYASTEGRNIRAGKIVFEATIETSRSDQPKKLFILKLLTGK